MLIAFNLRSVSGNPEVGFRRPKSSCPVKENGSPPINPLHVSEVHDASDEFDLRLESFTGPMEGSGRVAAPLTTGASVQ